MSIELFKGVPLFHTDFFGVEIEVLQIDKSKPAFNFKPVVYPIKPPVEGEPSERAKKYRNYFQTVIDELREKHHFTNAKIAQLQNWYSFSSGYREFIYSTSFAAGGKVRVEIGIDTRTDAKENKTIFDNLHSKKEKIEKLFGEPLTWERLENRRACRIAIYRAGSIDDEELKLKEYQKWAIDKLLEFKKVFGDGLDKFYDLPLTPLRPKTEKPG